MRPSITSWLVLLLGIFALLWILRPGHPISERAPVTEAYVDIHAGLKTALDAYQTDNGHFPKSLQELVQQNNDATNWRGPYLDKLPVDPWRHPYVYHFPGKHNPDSYDLLSVGPDGKEGTGDDIGNWMQ